MNTLVLDTTTKKIQAVMESAPTTTNPDFVCTYADNTGTAFTEGSKDGTLNGTSAVDIVDAPASSTRRTIKSIDVYNADSADVTVTIKYDNNGTDRIIAKVTLESGSRWTLGGTYDQNGNLLQAIGTTNVGKTLQHIIRTYDPSAKQDMSTTYADVNGSDYSFTPLSATSTILYRYHFHMAPRVATQTNVLHVMLLVDGVEQTESKTSMRAAENVAGGYGEHEGTYVHSLDSWGSSAKTIKMQGREYGASLGVKLFETTLSDGAVIAVLKRATLEIIEVE